MRDHSIASRKYGADWWREEVPGPAVVDSTITLASFAWFFLLFLGFIKLMPSMSIVEVKETLLEP